MVDPNKRLYFNRIFKHNLWGGLGGYQEIYQRKIAHRFLLLFTLRYCFIFSKPNDNLEYPNILLKDINVIMEVIINFILLKVFKEAHLLD